MKNLEELRRLQEIHAPEQLKERTLAAIEQGKEVIDMKQLRRKTRRRIATAVTGVAACFIVAVNASPAFALGLADIPALGALARIVCVRSDIYETADSTVTVSVPEVQGEQTDRVNQLIDEQVKAYEAKAAADLAEYKAAFLATGGTEEEFAAKDIQVKVDYDVKYQSDAVVSFVLTGSQDWNANTVERHYYNLRLTDGSVITLKDLLGENWVEEANTQIKHQMDVHDGASEMKYFTAEEGGFQTVDENTKFYLNEQGQPVVVFDKFEVAPGAMGEPEFTLDLTH